MGLILLLIVILITAFVMVNPFQQKSGGKFKEMTKNKFGHKVSSAIDFQHPIIEIVGPQLDHSVSKVVNALLIMDTTNTEYTYAIMVIVGGIQVGYLSDEDAEKFLKILNDKHLYEDTGIEVKALIYGDWGNADQIANFKINLNLPKNFEDSEIT
ncbi:MULTISPECIES: hypothetical protein [unclassified Acinetobacter]|jgi:hypothetical protein|uniref:hypothetical protein n=1 Tax=unclassified Acinetobacter TaxID=196816 RepID=UPI000A33F612|nr:MULTISPECIES: hypothetical protein [unclassified Acinetobacter]OTG69920.1 hypothetical protein B9T38_14170 [Acinetobacter sp. ANC 4218]QQN40767.1 hypothetical protein JFY49_07725 [Acinetobacter sp. CS-2]